MQMKGLKAKGKTSQRTQIFGPLLMHMHMYVHVYVYGNMVAGPSPLALPPSRSAI